jgi:hypothetical protein
MRLLAFALLILVEPLTAIQTPLVSLHEDSTLSGGHPPTLPTLPTQLKIPLQLVMTAKSGGIDDLPAKQRKNVRETLKLNPGVKLRFLTDEACREFISQNYGSQLLSAFDSEKRGSYRGDICRAAVIAIEGGFYADLDVQFRVPFVDTVDESTTFVSSFDIYCNVLNAFFAAEPSSTVMQSVVSAIKKWYANPKATRPKNSFLGTWTMLGGLKDVVKRDCPEVDLEDLTQLQRACGSHHQFRFYREQRIRCAAGQQHTGTMSSTECPVGRKNAKFDGTRFGIFEPGPRRNLVAWSRFESCTKWGCEERQAQNSTLGACPGQPLPHPVRPEPHPAQPSWPHFQHR